MTPLGCPDCLLIRYEPRALRARFRTRARARAPSHSRFPAKLVSLDFLPLHFFLGLLLFFRAHDACESRGFVVSRASDQPYQTMKSLMMLRFRLNIALPSLHHSVIPHAAEQSRLSINSAFCGEF